MYRVEAIVQTRTKEGEVLPKAPCGASIPVGWQIIEHRDGYTYYIREDRHAPR